MKKPNVRLGTAGWSIPKHFGDYFPGNEPHLVRYAARFPAAEINSSFHKLHRPSTYSRWAASVPDRFRFSVKVPKTITHEMRLIGTTDALDTFLAEARHLGGKLGPLLVQLPPSLAFSADAATQFFRVLRERFDGDVALEPRHASWFTPEAETLLQTSRIARVAAHPDPIGITGALTPGGWNGLSYFRLHGAPRVYYSTYEEPFLADLVKRLQDAARTSAVWCIFDNTASGAALGNCADVLRLMQSADRCREERE